MPPKKKFNFTDSMEKLGQKTIGFFTQLGESSVLLGKVIRSAFSKHFPFSTTIDQIFRIGYQSIPLIAFTSFFMGMVLAFSTGVYLNDKLSGIATYTGGTITLAFVREIGPILTSLLLTGRSGSSVAAEIGSMVVTEQVDAMVSMGVRPIQYLLLPRVIAGTFAMPILVFISDFSGIVGGSLVVHTYIKQSFSQYFHNALTMLTQDQVMLGFYKSIAFGFLVIFVSAYRGYSVKGGAESVGQATTQAVVYASIITVIADYIITMFAT